MVLVLLLVLLSGPSLLLGLMVFGLVFWWRSVGGCYTDKKSNRKVQNCGIAFGDVVFILDC